MLKRASRLSKKYWHGRYFVFNADNTLHYYKHAPPSSSSSSSQQRSNNREGGGDNAANTNSNKCRGSFLISDETGTEVSDLFVQKHQKKLIYCLRVKFSNLRPLDDDDDDRGGGMSDDDDDDDDHSLSSFDYSLGDSRGGGGPTTNPNNNHTAAPPSPTVAATDDNLSAPLSPSPIPKPSKQFLHRAKSTDSHLRFSPARRSSKNSNKQPSVAAGGGGGGRSVDNESLTLGSRWRARWGGSGGGGGGSSQHHHHARSLSNIVLPSDAMDRQNEEDDDDDQPVPESIQVTQSRHTRASTAGDVTASASTVPAGSIHRRTNSTATATATASKMATRRHYYSDPEREEQDYLRTQYLTEQKRNQRKFKQKVTQGTQLAAAGAATVGVAFFTAGVGLVAGLVALGLAGSAVGGGAAVTTQWGRRGRRRQREAVLEMASEDYETAKLWKSILDAALESDTLQNSTWGQLFAADGRHARSALLPNRSLKRVLSHGNLGTLGGGMGNTGKSGSSSSPKNGLMFANNARWTAVEGGILALIGSGYQGLRIFREEFYEAVVSCADARSNSSAAETGSRVVNQISVDGKPCPPMKAHTVISASPLDAFLCLMSHGRVLTSDLKYCAAPNVEHRASFEVVESIDEHADIIHMVFRPLFLFPAWTKSRDFVLYRYWRLEPDGSYVVCFESVEHRKCLPLNDHVRGEMHAVFNICPLKKSLRRKALKQNLPSECLMTATVQVDPRGWVPTTKWSLLSNQAYGDAFAVAALLQLVDIRDAIDQDRFIPVPMDDADVQSQTYESMDEMQELRNMAGSSQMGGIPHAFSTDTADETLHEDQVNYDFSYACNESVRQLPETATGITSTPPSLTIEKWAEPDANSFRVRGPAYLTDKKKYNAGDSIGRLIAVDVVSVDKPIYSGFSVHPTERIQLALKKERELKAKGQKSDMPPFIFVVNIALPGPPFFHGVYYYAIDDMSTINGSNGTPSSKLCNKFFFGDSDDFRDRTFKLIPQIVQGNFIVRKAVGSTPAIMGKKLRQEYVRSDRFCEVVLDCGSSPVATGVIRLSLGYAKTLVVDMGFLFEGDHDEYLPERIFGCVRMKHPDFGPSLRHVTAPPQE